MSAPCAARMASLAENRLPLVAAVGEDDHGATTHLVAEFDFGDGADGVEEERSAAARGTDVVVGLIEVVETVFEVVGLVVSLTSWRTLESNWTRTARSAAW